MIVDDLAEVPGRSEVADRAGQGCLVERFPRPQSGYRDQSSHERRVSALRQIALDTHLLDRRVLRERRTRSRRRHGVLRERRTRRRRRHNGDREECGGDDRAHQSSLSRKRRPPSTVMVSLRVVCSCTSRSSQSKSRYSPRMT